MGTAWGMTTADAVSELLETDASEVPLPTFPVLARLKSSTADSAGALADVSGRLAPARGLYDEVRVERQEDDGSFWVLARFVTVSVDAHTAVLGVHESLVEAGVAVDEVWVEHS